MLIPQLDKENGMGHFVVLWHQKLHRMSWLILQHNLKEQFGNSVDTSDDFALEWSCIPHFFHTPFYFYAYSFGNLLALSLFQRYKREGQDFVPSYINILSAGGSKKPELLLDEYGIDIGSSRFWQDGFDYVHDQVKQLSALN